MRSLSNSSNHLNRPIAYRNNNDAKGDGEGSAHSSFMMSQSRRTGLMPSASQPNQILAASANNLGTQIDDLSKYRQMLQEQEQMLAEQKKNI